MGEWFDYKIKFANKNESLAQALVNKGLATIKQKEGAGTDSLRLDLKRLNPVIFETGYGKDDGLDHIYIGINENDVY